MICPKCDGTMGDPTYSPSMVYPRGLLGIFDPIIKTREALIYRCKTCGYKKATDTKDKGEITNDNQE